MGQLVIVKESQQLRDTHTLISVEEGRPRDKSGTVNEKKKTERKALTNCQAQRKEQLRTEQQDSNRHLLTVEYKGKVRLD